MSHYNDYMDGVSVKISERYKRPPRIELPYTVSESITRAQNVVESSNYCTTFENNVLAKIKELRSAKETKKNERKHRLQMLEEEKQKKLDEIAAVEAQEKLKQLSVSEVSYPSTEDISALSPDEPVDNNCDKNVTPTQNSLEKTDVATITDFEYPKCSNPEPVPNILQPIQVAANYQQNLLDDPIVDPLHKLKMTSKSTKVPNYSNVETLTFKDFENDTSSPFDNVELKTINEMELLAQVLQSERVSNTSLHPVAYVQDSCVIPNSVSQPQINGMTSFPNNYIDQPVQGPSMQYSPQHYTTTNGYLENQIPINQSNMYLPNYQYYIPENQYMDPNVSNYYSNQIPVPDVNQMSNSFIPEPYYFHHSHVPMQYGPYDPQAQMQNLNADVLPVQNHIEVGNTKSNTQSIKSRSRSVPDIIKELNDEITMAKLRASERLSLSPPPKVLPRTSSDKKCDRKPEISHRRNEHLPNPFDKLPPKLQNSCQKISTMGFPLDRVARVCTLVEDDDKKIIESLLLLGELMDLGFPEGKVLAALAKHEFSKDKALDELVP